MQLLKFIFNHIHWYKSNSDFDLEGYLSSVHSTILISISMYIQDVGILYKMIK